MERREIFNLICLVALLGGVSAGEPKLMVAPVNLEMNFSNTTECNTWSFQEVELALPMTVYHNSSGVYKCTTGEDVILLVSVEYFDFAWQPIPVFAKKELAMNCFVRYGLGPFKISSRIVIKDDSTGNKVAENEAKGGDAPELDVETTADFVTTSGNPGEHPYSCIWSIDLEYNGKSYDYEMIISKNITVYLPVRNITVNHTGAKVGDKIICHAEGHPPPRTYSWLCQALKRRPKTDWMTGHSVIVFINPGDYSCKCTAENLIPPSFERIIWKGVIQVQPGEQASTIPIDEETYGTAALTTGKAQNVGGSKVKTGKKGKKKGGKDKMRKPDPNDSKKAVASNAPSVVHGIITPTLGIGTSCLVVLSVLRCVRTFIF